MSEPSSITECLRHFGIAKAPEHCESLDDEFKHLKEIFFQRIRHEHPDKGGSPEAFRKTRAAFDFLKCIYEKDELHSFFSQGKTPESTSFEDFYNDFDHENVPSYSYYEAAAQEEVPGYKVEYAKSGRSKCSVCRDWVQDVVTKSGKRKRSKKDPKGASKNALARSLFIEKGELRIGSLDNRSGSYSRWKHLGCWRVPMRIWLGLTNPKDPNMVLQDLLRINSINWIGFDQLDPEDQVKIVDFIMDDSHWAHPRVSAQKKAVVLAETAPQVSTSAPPPAPAGEQGSKQVVVAKKRFVIPKPGVNGAMGEQGLADKRFVLTGVFPEIGGGTGLSMGKDRVKDMIESFGGRVTSAVSGKTNYLVVGQEPGQSKVSKARKRGIPLLDLRALHQVLSGQQHVGLLETVDPPKIESFSAGYKMLTNW